jgi:putative transposase
MKAIKVQIYPNKRQQEVIAQTVGCCRYVYNWALERKIAFYQSTQKTLGKYALMTNLTKLKVEPDKEWLNKVSAQSLQQAIIDLDSAFSHFFRKNHAFPQFKSKRNAKQSYRVPQNFEVNRNSHYLKLPKLGWIRFIDEFHVPDDAVFRFITVLAEGGKYYASLCYKTQGASAKQSPIEPKKTIGIDLGLTTLATLSDGTKIENPRHLKKHEETIKHEQQELSKKKEGTKAYERQKEELNKAHRKVANTRRDFLHKLTTSLVENQDWTSFCVEDLSVQSMQQNHYLARAISDAGWRMFRGMMEYKCPDRGKNLIVIGRFDASSRTCTCGYVNLNLTLADRKWACPQCGKLHDRDDLASNNIKVFGLRKAGQSLLVA